MRARGGQGVYVLKRSCCSHGSRRRPTRAPLPARLPPCPALTHLHLHLHPRAEEGVRYFGEGQMLASDSFPGQDRTKLCLASKVPLGVVLAIPPFNYPVNLAVRCVRGGAGCVVCSAVCVAVCAGCAGCGMCSARGVVRWCGEGVGALRAGERARCRSVRARLPHLFSFPTPPPSFPRAAASSARR